MSDLKNYKMVINGDWVDSDSATSSMQTRTQSLFSDNAKTFDYHLWDKSKSRKCVCDATLA